MGNNTVIHRKILIIYNARIKVIYMLENIWDMDLHIGSWKIKTFHVYLWVNLLLWSSRWVQIALYHIHFLREENVKEWSSLNKLHNSHPSFLDEEYYNHLEWLGGFPTHL